MTDVDASFACPHCRRRYDLISPPDLRDLAVAKEQLKKLQEQYRLGLLMCPVCHTGELA